MRAKPWAKCINDTSVPAEALCYAVPLKGTFSRDFGHGEYDTSAEILPN
jgi:hypothetical protein